MPRQQMDLLHVGDFQEALDHPGVAQLTERARSQVDVELVQGRAAEPLPCLRRIEQI